MNDRYWTLVYPIKHPTLDFDIDKWETLSDTEIIDQYWHYWFINMLKADRPNSELTIERCIDDFCVVHWASRNYWREMKENIQ